jgi:hypothetical protein
VFDSLADRIKKDANQDVSRTERFLRWTLMAVVSVLLFGGLYLGVRLLD